MKLKQRDLMACLKSYINFIITERRYPNPVVQLSATYFIQLFSLSIEELGIIPGFSLFNSTVR